MKTFSLLWSTMLDSSLWLVGTKEAKLLFIAMLALKDKNGVVHKTVLGLAHCAILTPDECRNALVELESPDANSGNKDEDGRRIVPIEGGWRVVSHEKYQFSTDAKRAHWRESKRIQRERAEAFRLKKSVPLKDELAAVKAHGDGDEAKFDALTARGLK